MSRLHSDDLDVLRAIAELVHHREPATTTRIATETGLDVRTVEESLVLLGDQGYYDDRDAVYGRGGRAPIEVLELSPKARTEL